MYYFSTPFRLIGGVWVVLVVLVQVQVLETQDLDYPSSSSPCVASSRASPLRQQRTNKDTVYIFSPARFVAVGGGGDEKNTHTKKTRAQIVIFVENENKKTHKKSSHLKKPTDSVVSRGEQERERLFKM